MLPSSLKSTRRVVNGGIREQNWLYVLFQIISPCPNHLINVCVLYTWVYNVHCTLPPPQPDCDRWVECAIDRLIGRLFELCELPFLL